MRKLIYANSKVGADIEINMIPEMYGALWQAAAHFLTRLGEFWGTLEYEFHRPMDPIRKLSKEEIIEVQFLRNGMQEMESRRTYRNPKNLTMTVLDGLVLQGILAKIDQPNALPALPEGTKAVSKPAGKDLLILREIRDEILKQLEPFRDTVEMGELFPQRPVIESPLVRKTPAKIDKDKVGEYSEKIKAEQRAAKEKLEAEAQQERAQQAGNSENDSSTPNPNNQ